MNSKRLSELRYKGHITNSEYKELKLAIKALEERQQGEIYTFEQVQELVKLNQQFAEEIENLKRQTGGRE